MFLPYLAWSSWRAAPGSGGGREGATQSVQRRHIRGDAVSNQAGDWRRVGPVKELTKDPLGGGAKGGEEWSEMLDDVEAELWGLNGNTRLDIDFFLEESTRLNR